MVLQLNSDDLRDSCAVFVLGLEKAGKSRQSSSLKYNDTNLSTLLGIVGSSKCFSAPVPRKNRALLIDWRNKLRTKTEVFQASPKQSCYSARISVLIDLSH